MVLRLTSTRGRPALTLAGWAVPAQTGPTTGPPHAVSAPTKLGKADRHRARQVAPDLGRAQPEKRCRGADRAVGPRPREESGQRVRQGDGRQAGPDTRVHPPEQQQIDQDQVAVLAGGHLDEVGADAVVTDKPDQVKQPQQRRLSLQRLVVAAPTVGGEGQTRRGHRGPLGRVAEHVDRRAPVHQAGADGQRGRQVAAQVGGDDQHARGTVVAHVVSPGAWARTASIRRRMRRWVSVADSPRSRRSSFQV